MQSRSTRKETVSVDGPGTYFTYEWRVIGNNDSDRLYYSDNSNTSRTSSLMFQAGIYYVIVTNNLGAVVRSDNFIISDDANTLQISSQPQGGQLQSGNIRNATVQITGTGTSFTYEWRKINNDGSDQLYYSGRSTPSMQGSLEFKTGTFYVIVRNNLGANIRSDPFTISNPGRTVSRASTSNTLSKDSVKTYYVSISGNDSNDCLSRNNACKTIQSAADRIRGGDKLIILQGDYYESPKFLNLGSSSTEPVWILAEPRGKVRISGAWKPAVLGQVIWNDEGNGVYSTPYNKIAAPLFAHYKNVFLPRFLTVSDLYSSRVLYRDSSNGYTTINALHYGYTFEGGRLYIRLPRTLNNSTGDLITECPANEENSYCESNQNLPSIDPNGESIEFSTATWENSNSPQSLISVVGSPYLIFDGFRLEGSGTFCLDFSRDSIAPTIRNTVFENCRYGARLPDSSLVEWSEYTYRGFKSFSDQLKAISTDKQFKTFQYAKNYLGSWWEGGLADTYGHDGTSINSVFHHNYLHHAFDGESLGDFEFSESHHNVYESNYDDHVEMESWSGASRSRELHLHHNLFLSRGIISHQGDSIEGPHYVYRNVYYYNDAELPGFSVIKSKAPNANGGIFYYHNLIWTKESFLYWQASPLTTLDHLNFRNNIFVFKENWNKPVTGHPINSDHNIFVNDLDRDWIHGPSGQYLGSTPGSIDFRDSANLDFNINNQSPASNTGTLIPGFHNDPVFNDYINGSTPDIGPFESGRDISTPDWPRPRSTVFDSSEPVRWKNAVGS